MSDDDDDSRDETSNEHEQSRPHVRPRLRTDGLYIVPDPEPVVAVLGTYMQQVTEGMSAKGQMPDAGDVQAVVVKVFEASVAGGTSASVQLFALMWCAMKALEALGRATAPIVVGVGSNLKN